MTPSRVAAHLRNLASKINQLDNPNKSIIAKDLRKIIAGVYESGDPNTNGFDYTVNLKLTTHTLSISGQIDGKPVSGELELHYTSIGKYYGYDWVSDEGSIDLEDAENDDALTNVLESAEEELKKTGRI